MILDQTRAIRIIILKVKLTKKKKKKDDKL